MAPSSWKPGLPGQPDDRHVCRDTPNVPCKCQAAKSADHFEAWLEHELSALLDTFREWETAESNRKYFQR